MIWWSGGRGSSDWEELEEEDEEVEEMKDWISISINWLRGEEGRRWEAALRSRGIERDRKWFWGIVDREERKGEESEELSLSVERWFDWGEWSEVDSAIDISSSFDAGESREGESREGESSLVTTMLLR
jgi:hypothetical protein